MAKRPLVVSIRADIHADLVAERVEARGTRLFRLNLDEFPEHFSIDLEWGGSEWSGSLTHIPTGDSLCLPDIGAVWMRKKARFSYRSKDLAPQERAHADAETRHLLLGLLYSLDCYWMSHPLALRAASWKGEQLKRAARMGFATPPSIVTNRPSRVSDFIESQGDIVFKPVSSPSLAAERVASGERLAGSLPTTMITADHAGDLDAVAEAPCFFQRYVAKRHELRVTVIGDQVFSARIHSQDDPRTATDWRDMSAEILFERADLPADVEFRCLDLVRSYGLTFGALDLIVTPDGDYVFLEVNPAGQFLFVQELVPELDMIGAVADRLVEGCGAGRADR